MDFRISYNCQRRLFKRELRREPDLFGQNRYAHAIQRVRIELYRARRWVLPQVGGVPIFFSQMMEVNCLLQYLDRNLVWIYVYFWSIIPYFWTASSVHEDHDR